MTLPASQASLAAIFPNLASMDASSHAGHYQLPSQLNMSPNTSAAPSKPGSPMDTPSALSPRQQSSGRSRASSSPTSPLTLPGAIGSAAPKSDLEPTAFDSPWAKPPTVDDGSSNSGESQRDSAFSSPTSGENLASSAQSLEEADAAANNATLEQEDTRTPAQIKADDFKRIFSMFGTMKAEEDHGIRYE